MVSLFLYSHYSLFFETSSFSKDFLGNLPKNISNNIYPSASISSDLLKNVPFILRFARSALTDLYKNQPFQREFQNESGEFVSNGLVDWFVANLAQQGPMILESIAVALVGGVAGGLAGGGANPFTALGGSLSALMGKESFKQGVLAAAKKYSKNQPMTVGEKKLLREVSGMAGATKIKNDVKYNNPFTGAKNRAIRDDALEYTGAKIAGKSGATQARIGGAAGFSILSFL